jgi:polyhydroxyalkanoate synthesis regulator phasin
MLDNSFKPVTIKFLQEMKAEREQKIEDDRLKCGKITAEYEFYKEISYDYSEYKEIAKTRQKEYENFISRYINETEKEHETLRTEINCLDSIIQRLSKNL